jgi:hypothetical protein
VLYRYSGCFTIINRNNLQHVVQSSTAKIVEKLAMYQECVGVYVETILEPCSLYQSVAPDGPSMPPPIKKETWVAGKQEGQKVEPFPFHYRYLTVKVIIIGHLLKAMS